MTELMSIHDNRKSFYGKAIVEEGRDGYYLYSYLTRVFMIPFDKYDDGLDVEMELLWDGYSETTYSHIREFIKQYASEWQKRGLSKTITKKEIKSFL